jgi:hypothetical protein
MRTCNRNKRPIWFANFYKSEPSKDEHGKESGEQRTTYTAPEKLMTSVAYASTDTEVAMFGVKANDLIKILLPADCTKIKENSVFWFEVEPPTSYKPAEPRNNFMYAGAMRGVDTTIIYAKRVVVR